MKKYTMIKKTRFLVSSVQFQTFMMTTKDSFKEGKTSKRSIQQVSSEEDRSMQNVSQAW